MFDARPQQPLGSFNSPNRATQRCPQFENVLRRTVGQIFLGLRPNEFVRVELGSVSREAMNMKPILAGQELLDDVSPVNGASIPDEFHVAPQVTQKVAQELAYFFAPDVGGMELRVESHALALGRHRDARDGRDSIARVAVPKQGRFAHRCPGLGDVGNQQKAAFVEKRQMGVTFLGFFLYAARWFSSSAQSLLRSAGSPGARVSANSTQAQRTSHAKRGWAGSESRNAGESLPRSASTSKDRWSTRRPAIPSPESASVFPSGARTTGTDVLRSVWAEVHAARASCAFDTSARPNSGWHSKKQRRPGTAFPLSASQWPDVFASPNGDAFHEVSCPKAYDLFVNVSIV